MVIFNKYFWIFGFVVFSLGMNGVKVKVLYGIFLVVFGILVIW